MKHKALIVDDEALLVRTLSQAFREAGFEVASAGSAEEALEVYASHAPFDLIVVDNRLPGKSGLDLLEAVERPADTRVVLMTAYDTADTHKRSLQLGVDLYLKKPFDLESLLSKASELVGKGAEA
ncbi:MAG: response regulator [Candidatus Eisenbacteria bacterium]|nr:response regulator [Candidatus Eisenbacteria bacterium]